MPRGSIAVTTSASVEVFVDGVFQGRTLDAPLVINEVEAGPRRVTLRRGAREHEVRGTVRADETWAVTHDFEDADTPAADVAHRGAEDAFAETKVRLRKAKQTLTEESRDVQAALEAESREVRETLKDGLQQAQEKLKAGSEETLEKLRGVLNRFGETGGHRRSRPKHSTVREERSQ